MIVMVFYVKKIKQNVIKGTEIKKDLGVLSEKVQDT